MRDHAAAWRNSLLLLVVLLFLSQAPEVGAFTSLQQQPSIQRSISHSSTSKRLIKGTRRRPNTQGSSALWAISSRELRKREEGEKQARIERRRKATTKRKTVKASSGSSDKLKGSRKVLQVKKKKTSDTATGAKQKKAKKPPQKTKAALTQRLQRATAKAKAAAIEADYANKRQLQQEEQGSGSSGNSNRQGRPFLSAKNATNDNDHHTIGTLTQLTKIIDKELRAASDGTATFNVHGTTNPPPGITRDSMRSLLEENDAQWSLGQRRHERSVLAGGASSSTNPVRHIAVVMSKPLVQDQVTLEYACRLRTLAKAMQSPDTAKIDNGLKGADATTISDTDVESIPYRPNIVCFLGPTSNGNLLADADAGYIYFNHLCAANQISLDGVDILLEKSTLGKGALKNVMRHLRQEYIAEWWKESYPIDQSPSAGEHRDNEDDDDYDEDDRMRASSSPSSISTLKKKIQLHFTFFSCDYDLCRINDIHYRSPRQSVLRHLVEDDEQEEQSLRATGSMASHEEMVDTSWSYRFSTYPYVHFKDPVTAYLGKCFLLAEELTPVLVNIRGVNDGTEFFQRDNYRVLVSIRRSFVNDMEQFYKRQPSLKTTLRQYVSNSDYPLDVVLEGALLSLGRCLDLVRPAGLLIGYVPKEDWKTAEIVLQHAVRQLRDACDPDHPLDPGDWGKLDHHYDQQGDDKSSVDSTGEELAALNNWRTEEEVDEDYVGYTEQHAP